MDIWPILNSAGLALLGAALTFIAARYWYRKAADKELRARVAELEKQQSLTNLVAQPIWAAIQAKLVAELTHFHEPATDALLEKLGPPCIITDAEMAELEAAMLKRELELNGMIPPDERDAARMLIPVTRRVKAEAEAMAAASQIELQMVAVPVSPAPEALPVEPPAGKEEEPA